MGDKIAKLASEKTIDAISYNIAEKLGKMLFAKSFEDIETYSAYFMYKGLFDKVDVLRIVYLSAKFKPKHLSSLFGRDAKWAVTDFSLIEHEAEKYKAKYVIVCAVRLSSFSLEQEYQNAVKMYAKLKNARLYDYILIRDGLCRCFIGDLKKLDDIEWEHEENSFNALYNNSDDEDFYDEY